jgi:hypothetical protein
VKREPISKRLRFEVFKRDGFVCQYCGSHPPDVVLEPDHIVPVCEGGPSIIENLVTACFDCNRGKAGVPLTSVPRTLDQIALETQERELQIAGYREVMQARADRIEDDMWRVAEELKPGCMKSGMRRDWLRSIMMFNERLPLHEVLDAADLAFSRKPTSSDGVRFRYFCGICWNKIRAADQ